MKPINTTKLLIRMTNVYMKNIDTSHDTHLHIKVHILMRIRVQKDFLKIWKSEFERLFLNFSYLPPCSQERPYRNQ